MLAPPPSVPSGNSRLGGSNTSPTCAFGSPSMSSGPASARNTNTPSTKTATIADLLRRTGAAIARHFKERVGEGASSTGGAPV